MYRAFFSYSRGDERAAGAHHRMMDSYRTPKSLRGEDGMFGPVPDTLHPIFRDRTDLSGGGRLDGKIRAALENSETLVVLCSPNAAASDWVDQEVAMFLALGRHDRVFPVIAPGLPG